MSFYIEREARLCLDRLSVLQESKRCRCSTRLKLQTEPYHRKLAQSQDVLRILFRDVLEGQLARQGSDTAGGRSSSGFEACITPAVSASSTVHTCTALHHPQPSPTGGIAAKSINAERDLDVKLIVKPQSFEVPILTVQRLSRDRTKLPMRQRA